METTIATTAELVDLYRKATNNLQDARVQYAQEWQLARLNANSDMQATQIAIEKTHDAVTEAIAQQKATEMFLRYALEKAARRSTPAPAQDETNG